MSGLLSIPAYLVIALVVYSMLCSKTQKCDHTIIYQHTYNNRDIESVYNAFFDSVWAGKELPSILLTFVEQNKSLTPLIRNPNIKNERCLFGIITERIVEINKSKTIIKIKYVIEGMFASDYAATVTLEQHNETKLKWEAKWKASKFSLFGTEMFQNWLQNLYKSFAIQMEEQS
eukprot:505123_1